MELFDRLKDNITLESPPSGHEERFLAKLNSSSIKKKRRKFDVRVAAVFIGLLLATSGLLYVTFGDQFSSSSDENMTIKTQMADLKDEYQQFTPMIEENMLEIKRLEEEYKELEETWLTTGNDKVFEAMKENMHNREMVLEKTQKRLHKLKTKQP